MAWLFAFLHHAAAFALVAALTAELVLLRSELNPQTVRRLQRADMALGLSATLLLVVGLLRVFYFEKGAAYYFQNTAFLVKSSRCSSCSRRYPSTRRSLSPRGAGRRRIPRACPCCGASCTPR